MIQGRSCVDGYQRHASEYDMLQNMSGVWDMIYDKILQEVERWDQRVVVKKMVDLN
ncbi:hypothetical protein SAMN04487934_105103 [Eubacterium ruminantium]|nr:hypothetical protein SAMN04487934_105103 [Eubacterium ruminantium]